ncbi:MAG: Zn-ribbon domain-containing OB-fold protein [Candidatus Nezhaarchaeota archaeon]|nr:Zn-ribbon domain-containing OB-fold protein [Candidatus Nezhaarchaeota archaeon]MCX8141527.1 Zn-ribbon domain-containing OB-fold protein [Candidatus Nezhaarchaeota archaeon]MDW8049794.1 Zn-ribbon domain-containing OB-fold protein [Nitrososphaerota archaeon]
MATSAYWRTRLCRYRLIGNRCQSCDRVFFPPRFMCPYCNSTKLEECKLPDRGRLLEYTIVYSTPKGYEAMTPYVVGLVELENGVRVLAQITDVNLENIKEGMEVEACIRRIPEQLEEKIICYTYKFRPVIK